MQTALIYARAANGVIGKNGTMPWHLPEDLAHFKALTQGHPVIMGRKTYHSIGAALPGRTNIVVTRNKDFEAADADVVHDLSEALTKAKATEEHWRPDGGREEIFVIGGADIYGQALPEAQRIYMTEVNQELPGDAFFPELAEGEWKETDRQDRDPETSGGPAYSLVIFDRVGG